MDSAADIRRELDDEIVREIREMGDLTYRERIFERIRLRDRERLRAALDENDKLREEISSVRAQERERAAKILKAQIAVANEDIRLSTDDEERATIEMARGLLGAALHAIRQPDAKEER